MSATYQYPEGYRNQEYASCALVHKALQNMKPLEDGQTEVILAGSTNRQQKEFNSYFQHISHAFEQALTKRG